MEDFVRYSCSICGELTALEALEIIQTDSSRKSHEPWTKGDAWDLAHFRGEHTKKEQPK